MTTTSLRTHLEYNISYPVFVVCNRHAFRSTDFVLTKEQYDAQVLSFNETFRAENFAPELWRGKMNITEMDSLV